MTSENYQNCGTIEKFVKGDLYESDKHSEKSKQDGTWFAKSPYQIIISWDH